MRLKRLPIVFLLALLMLSSFNITTFAAQTISVKITGVKQAKDNWCWAACAEMAGKCVYSSSNRTQYSVVNHLKGTSSNAYPDVSGSIGNSATGSEYVAYNKKTFRGTSSIWTYGHITQSLVDGYPVQAAAGYYQGNKRNGGHVVVIYMTQMVDSSSGTKNYVTYLDPADKKTYHCTYSSFCDGSYNERKYDQTAYVVPN